MKKCSKCGDILEDSCFYPKFNYCKLCQRKIVRKKDKRNTWIPHKGYVYLVKFEANGDIWYKIGQSSNVKQRLYSFRTECPWDIELLHKIKTDNMTQLENELHDRFYWRNKKGDFFRLSCSDIEYIKEL